MNEYKLKLTALSPVHIGTGEVYEPTNFVIDDGCLYEFDEILFFRGLDKFEKQSFHAKLDDYLQIIDFYKKESIRAKAKKIYKTKIEVSPKVQNRYKSIKNQDGSRNQNLFEIHKTFKNPNTHKAIIPGSSIKGMLDTVLNIYPKRGDNNTQRQKLIVSDALSLECDTKISYCYRRHKNPEKKAKSDIPQIVELIPKNATFILSLKTEHSIEKIVKMFQKYFNQKSRINSYFATTESSFVAKIGKFSGKAFMVYDGSNVKNNDGKQIATHTLSENNEEFGWIKIEQITDEEFDDYQKQIQLQTEQYFVELGQREKETKMQYQLSREKAKQDALEKQKKQEEEEKQKLLAQKREEERFANMSEVEKEIEKLLKQNENIPVSTLILNNIDKFESDTCEVLKTLRNLMIQNSEWKEETKAKKPQKDKPYQKTLRVLELLKKC